jgi:hypothetical protein
VVDVAGVNDKGIARDRQTILLHFKKSSCRYKKEYDKINFVDRKSLSLYGALAQLGERYTGSVEVSGSSPLCSILKTLVYQGFFLCVHFCIQRTIVSLLTIC